MRDDAYLLAAAVAYYVGLGFYPLLLVIIAGVGFLLQWTTFGQNAEEQVLAVLSGQLSPTLVEHIQKALAELKDRSAINGPVGLIATLLTAMAAFAQFDRAFNRIWRVAQPPSAGILRGVKTVLIDRGIAFLMLLLMGLVVAVVAVVSFGVSAVEATTQRWINMPAWLHNAVHAGIPFVINLLILSLIYRWIPRAKQRFADAFRGAVVAAMGWEIGRRVLSMVLMRSKFGMEYGVIGSFIAIQLWCYYVVAVIFLGAEYIRERCLGPDVDVPARDPCSPREDTTG